MLILFFVSNNASAQFGIIDSTFGISGIVTTPLSNDGGVYLQQIHPLADGKIIATGYCNIVPLTFFVTVKYNNDGTTDNAFGTNGVVYSIIDSSYSYSYGSTIQTDGKIILCGDHSTPLGYEFVLIRYNTDGSIDNSFGINGIVKHPVGSSTLDNYGQAVVQQMDGKILLAGTSSNGTNKDFTVIRFNIDGTIDNSFGTSGDVVTDVGGGYDYCYDLALQADGKIILSGDIQVGTDYQLTAVRYNTDGTLDNSFGTNGISTIDNPSNPDNNYGLSVAIQPNQQIVIGGRIYNNATNYDFGAIRLNTNGSLDNNFGNGGFAIADVLNDSTSNQGSAMTLQPDGKIIITGSTIGTIEEFATARFNSNGTLDNTFGISGIVLTEIFPISTHNSLATAVDADGKILIGGEVNNTFPDNFILVRYTSGVAVGIEDPQLSISDANHITVSPNPASSVCTIRSNELLSEIVILDIAGKKIYQSKILSERIEVAVNDFVNGIYFVQLKTEKNFETIKLSICK